MRIPVTAVAASIAAGSLVGLAGAGHAARGCHAVEKGGTTEAVFGHFPTQTQALAFIRDTAERKGFKGLVVENDGCGDFEVENPGIAQGQRPAFVLEGAQSGLQVSFEQTTPPDRIPRGFVNAVFGTTRSVDAAERLRLKVAGVGSRYLDLFPTRPGTWQVVAPHIPARSQTAFRDEARRAKLRVTFVRR